MNDVHVLDAVRTPETGHSTTLWLAAICIGVGRRLAVTVEGVA